MIMRTISSMLVVRSSIDEKKNKPKTMIDVPIIAKTLYLPVLEMICPLNADAMTNAIINGVRISPACVADPPITPCEKSGTYKIAPNIPIDVRNNAQADTRNTLFLNRSSDRIGLAVLFSIVINMNREIKESTSEPMIGHEDHAY